MDNDHEPLNPTINPVLLYPAACLAAALLLMTLATTIWMVAHGYWTWDMFANFWAQRSFS